MNSNEKIPDYIEEGYNENHNQFSIHNVLNKENEYTENSKLTIPMQITNSHIKREIAQNSYNERINHDDFLSKKFNYANEKDTRTQYSNDSKYDSIYQYLRSNNEELKQVKNSNFIQDEGEVERVNRLFDYVNMQTQTSKNIEKSFDNNKTYMKDNLDSSEYQFQFFKEKINQMNSDINDLHSKLVVLEKCNQPVKSTREFKVTDFPGYDTVSRNEFTTIASNKNNLTDDIDRNEMYNLRDRSRQSNKTVDANELYDNKKNIEDKTIPYRSVNTNNLKQNSITSERTRIKPKYTENKSSTPLKKRPKGSSEKNKKPSLQKQIKKKNDIKPSKSPLKILYKPQLKNLIVNTNNTKSRQPVQTKKHDANEKYTDSKQLKEENIMLKNKVSELESIIKKLKWENKIDELQKKGKDSIRLELEIWKDRSEKLASNYLVNINEIKKQLSEDKDKYTKEIKHIQLKANQDINTLSERFTLAIEKYERDIQEMKKENKDLRKKINKVQNILV